MYSKVFEEGYSSSALIGPNSTSFSGTNNTVTSLTENLQHIFTDEAQVKNFFLCDDGAYNVDKGRLISILNKIAETEEGCNILKALKTELNKIPDDRRIMFQLNDENTEQDKFLKNCGFKPEEMSIEDKKAKLEENRYQFSDNKNFYMFDSLRAIQYPQMPLIININKNLMLEQRCIFGKNEITKHEFPANKESEAYFIAHELTHVVSFLNFFAENPNGNWEKRKDTNEGWVNFFNETKQMQTVYHGLLLDGFTPKQIIDTFRTFFLNTEEARNVLGLVKGVVDGQETFIGEGEMFKERNHFDGVIVTYLNEPRQLNVIEKAILNKIIDIFQLGVSYINDCPQFLDANDALGDQFAGFNLVNSDENNIKSTFLKIPIKVASNAFNNFYEVVNDHVEYCKKTYRSFCTPYTESIIKCQIELENLSVLAKDIKKPIVLVRSDDKNPQNYTFRKFENDTPPTSCEGTFQQIYQNNENAVFIYYNGVNNFQALVPQQPAQQTQN